MMCVPRSPIAREPDGGDEAVVEAGEVPHAGAVRLLPHLVRLVGRQPERLLADDVLARARGRDRRLGVDRVRPTVVEQRHAVVGDLLSPVRDGLAPAPLLAGAFDTVPASSRDRHELRAERHVEMLEREQRARMRLAHEGVAEHCDADGVGAHRRPAAARHRRATASSVTASRRIAPSTISFTSGPCPIRSSPLPTLPMTSAPRSADQTLPRPPKRLVPPITAGAIASSVTWPGLIARLAAARRLVWVSPA